MERAGFSVSKSSYATRSATSHSFAFYLRCLPSAYFHPHGQAGPSLSLPCSLRAAHFSSLRSFLILVGVCGPCRRGMCALRAHIPIPPHFGFRTTPVCYPSDVCLHPLPVTGTTPFAFGHFATEHACVNCVTGPRSSLQLSSVHRIVCIQPVPSGRCTLHTLLTNERTCFNFYSMSTCSPSQLCHLTCTFTRLILFSSQG